MASLNLGLFKLANQIDWAWRDFHPGFIILPTFLGFCLIAQELNQAHIEKQQKKRGIYPAHY